VETEGSAAWTAEINNALTGTGSLSDYSVAAAGTLTFRNIRLSPEPDANYPAPTANAGVPAGYYDVQEATLYVSDSATTPDLDQFLILTLDGQDFLSGGPAWTPEADYSGDTSAWTSLEGTFDTQGTTGDIGDITGITMSNAGGQLVIQTNATQPNANRYLLGIWQLSNYPVTEGGLYRLSGDVESSNTDATQNAALRWGLNGRSSAGFGHLELVREYAGGPTQGAPQELNGYLVPSMTASDIALYMTVYDDGAQGGTWTASNIVVESLASVDELVGGVQKAAFNDFTVGTTISKTPTEWAVYDFNSDNQGESLAYVSTLSNAPNITQSPAVGATGAQLTYSVATVPTGTAGFSTFETGTAFSIGAAEAGKLIVYEGVIATTSSDTAQLPDFSLDIVGASGRYQGRNFQNRTSGNETASGPTATPKSYYSIVDAREGDYELTFRCYAEDVGDNGTLALSQVTVTVYDAPAAP
jgi:hypothetical protein